MRALALLQLVPGDDDWPVRLDDLGEHAPPALWVRGNPAALGRDRALSLVGARAATGYGEHVAAELAAVLAADGTMGEAYYDDDDAFEFILDHMAAARRAKEKDMDALAAFVDQYMELQEQYLGQAGLLSWD